MSDNPLKLKRIDHVEFYTGNAKQAAYYYRQAFGFSQFAYSGLETGVRDASSYALRQGKANFVFTSPLSIDHPSTEHVRRHGDGVHDIAFEVDDVDSAFEYVVSRGAVPAMAAGHDRRCTWPRPTRCDSYIRRHHSLVHFATRLCWLFHAWLRIRQRARQ